MLSSLVRFLFRSGSGLIESGFLNRFIVFGQVLVRKGFDWLESILLAMSILGEVRFLN